MASDRTGQQLGNYLLTQLLGKGGFAEVYLGEHIHLNTQAAIKLLYAQLTSDDVKEFRQEARIVARLRHPNIVSILDFGVEQGIPFLVMDYAPNGTLRQRHARGVRLSPATILGYIRQVADALQFAHSERLIHRDIKPENMLIGRRGEVLLSDFGIAVVMHDTNSQTPQQIAGTVTYMAPEQLRGKPVPASDQYSLAVVVYEWLCGQRPFKGTFAELAAQHLNVQPPSLLEQVPHLPPALEEVVLTALAKHPAQRYPTVLDFVDAFEAASLLQSRPAARASNLPRGIPRPTRRRTLDASPDLSVFQDDEETSQQVPPTRRAQPVLPARLNVPVRDRPLPAPAHGTIRARRPIVAEPPAKKRSISRRTILAGLGGLIGVGLLAGGSALLSHSTYSINNALRFDVGTPKSNPSAVVNTGTRGKLYNFRKYNDTVSSIAWSHDGKLIASGNYDNTVQLWNPETGTDDYAYQGHHGAVYSVVWSPNGNYIASGSYDKTIRVWDATNGNYAFTCSGHTDTVSSVAWSPDGKYIASGSRDNTVQIWDATNGTHVFTYQGHSNWVRSVAWSPNGNFIASASHDGTVQVWDSGTRLPAYKYSRTAIVFYTVAWSPNGRQIASAGFDGTVQVWNAFNGAPIYSYGNHTDSVFTVAWSPNGIRIASGSADTTVRIWNASDGNDDHTYHGHHDFVDSVAWSPNGSRIASGSKDKTWQIWQAI